MSDNQTTWEFKGDDSLSQLLKQIEERFEGIEGAVNGVEEQINSVIGGAKGGIITFNQFADAAHHVTDILQQGIAVYSEYDSQIKELQAITGIAGQDLERLGDSARRNGIDFSVGASQGVEAYKLLASNIDIETIGGVEGLQKLGTETILLSKAAKISLPDAAQTAASALNQYGESAEQASRYVNVLAAGSKFGAAEIPDLAMSLKEAGAVAHQAGLNIESTVAPIEILSQNAIKGSEAGTALRNIVLRLQTVLGMDVGKKGLPATLKALQPYLKDTTFLTKAFGMENINAAQVLIANADAVADMEKKVTGTNVAYEQAAINMSAFEEKVGGAKARIDELLIRLGIAIEPALTAILNGVNQALDWLMNNGPLVADIITSIMYGVAAGTAVWAAFNAQMIIANAWLWLTTAAQWALNVAMTANPIGIVVVAVGALIAGLVLAYKQSQTFRAVLAGIGNVAKTLLDIFIGLGKSIIGAFTLDFDLVKEGMMQSAQAVLDIKNKGIGGIFNEGYDKLITDEAAEEAAKKAKESAEKDGVKTTEIFKPKAGGGATGGPAVIGGGSPTSLKGGNNAPRNVYITIQSLVKEININNTTVKNGISNVKNEIVEVLTGVVRDSEIAISNG